MFEILQPSALISPDPDFQVWGVKFRLVVPTRLVFSFGSLQLECAYRHQHRKINPCSIQIVVRGLAGDGIRRRSGVLLGIGLAGAFKVPEFTAKPSARLAISRGDRLGWITPFGMVEIHQPMTQRQTYWLASTTTPSRRMEIHHSYVLCIGLNFFSWHGSAPLP
jgi:hypothetical protein